MIAAWRIDFAKHTKEQSFSGDGAAKEGGRWNRPGTRMVYAADSQALAALEKFIHLGDEGRRLKYVSYRINIPASVRIDERKLTELPKDWRSTPAPQSTMNLGSKWVQDARSPVLRLPSIAIKTGYNYLLNPLHPDFARLLIYPPEAFVFDSRMWKA